MKLDEATGKSILAQYGLSVPRGIVITCAEEAEQVAATLGPVAVKAQILAGKRGKSGGIRFASDPVAAREAASELLKKQIQGIPVSKVLIEEKLDIEREFYLALTLDTYHHTTVYMASSSGGMDIEEVEHGKILSLPWDINKPYFPFVGRGLASGIGLTGAMAKDFARWVTAVTRVFREWDAELIEINPLGWVGDRFVAADAKIVLDDEALFRHPDWAERKVEDDDVLEQKAREWGLAFVRLDGDIAVMANGAGITMATLDAIKYYGGYPANFLDAGGGANVEQTERALHLLLATDPKVILVNIFGGITRCDDVARAITQVCAKTALRVPLIIRLTGTNIEEGIKILSEFGLTAYREMEPAVQKAVELAWGGVN